MGSVNSLDSLDFFPARNAIKDADLRGSPVARLSRLNALFQIEKNFSKEVSNRGREEGDQVAAWLVALSGVWFWGDSICPVCAFY